MQDIVKNTRTCYFTSGFGKPDSAERSKSDLLYNEVQVPVCAYLKYNAIRAGRINNSIIKELPQLNYPIMCAHNQIWRQ